MMRSDFLCRVLSVLWLFVSAATPVHALDKLRQSDCRDLQPATETTGTTLSYADAVLWQVDRAGTKPSYLFGTIHVADERVTTLPEPVSQALLDSSTFVMEALPDAEESLKLSQMMLLEEGQSLADFLDQALYEKTLDILGQYRVPAEAASLMRPWAAFLVMNYPAETGLPLDFQLLDKARQAGTRLLGLETLSEQGEIFATMSLPTQLQLLLDTICNHATIRRDFEVMKTLYLQRDLQALYDYNNRYTVADDAVYQDLLQRLLFDRNHLMVKRMLPVLENGDAFIAIGAMHLPGAGGVLSLLAEHGYSITAIY